MKKELLSPSPAGRADKILLLLERNSGWCSGEMISSLLGVSRAAVAKHIAGLRARGHAIQSVSGRGHKLLLKHEPLDASAVGVSLRTRHIGRGEWRVYPETTSSNDEAIKLALAGAASGSIVLAERQSQGRGRKGHDWFSAPHALMFSVLLRPSAPTAELAWLTAAGVLAVTEALADMDLSPQVKAPNDILLGQRKVAGVLLETGLRGGETDWAVLGIGCNVNTLPEDVPPLLQSRITSIFAETAVPASRVDLLAAILNRLELWYDHLESGKTRLIRECWERHLGKQATPPQGQRNTKG